MSTDPTDPLEVARRANRALQDRVVELERQLKRSASGAELRAPLGTTISERQALLSEVERLAHLGSWVWNLVTDEVIWSDELYRIFGYDPATVSASSEGFFAVVHPEDRPRLIEAAARSTQLGYAERLEYRVVRPDGSVRHVTMDEAMLFDAEGNVQRAVGAVLDVTELRESEQALKRTADLLAEAQRIGKMGSFEVNLVEPRISWSDELYRILDLESSVEPNLELFVQCLHEDDRARIVDLMERSQRTGFTTPSRARLVRRDGTIRHVDMMGLALRDAQDNLIAIRGTISDVTDLVRLEAQFHQSQKMDAVGQLAGGLAHDYNNLLMVISGNAELLLDQQDTAEASQILAAATAATSLTNRLLTFSRQSTQRARVVELARDLEESKGLIQRALGDRVSMRFELGSGVWPVFVDSGQVQQVLLNLALNARDAMPEGGTLLLSVSNRSLGAAEAQQRNERPGDYVTLRVMDTGIGMDEATRSRAFEPFFTTKPPGRGTGLGLAMVFGSMKQCGGFVEVQSQPRAGTTFTLWFPRATQSQPPQVEVVRDPPRASARVLLVEDNVAVATVATRILESAGYSVRVTLDPTQALKMWAAEPADVLVTDVEMPGMTGIRLSERLREHTPELRTLFITGHSTERIDLSAHAGRSVIVMKPFRRGELLHALAQVLART
jgi:two-component system, cell cycle sensor histidine kinase and response regulator CckA